MEGLRTMKKPLKEEDGVADKNAKIEKFDDCIGEVEMEDKGIEVSDQATDDWEPNMVYTDISDGEAKEKKVRDMNEDLEEYYGSKNARINEPREDLRDYLESEYNDKVWDGDLSNQEVWELDRKLSEDIRAIDKNPNELSILGITEEGRYLVAYQERYLVGKNPGSGDIMVEELPFDELKNIWRVYTKYGFFNYDIKNPVLKEKEMKTILKVLESDMLVVSSCTWYNIGILKRSETRDLCEVKLLVRDTSSKDLIQGGFGALSKAGYSECTMRVVIPVVKMENIKSKSKENE